MHAPGWIAESIDRTRCQRCFRGLDRGCVVGVGARYLEQRSGLRAGPVGFVLLRCPKCFATKVIEKIITRRRVHEAVDALYK